MAWIAQNAAQCPRRLWSWAFRLWFLFILVLCAGSGWSVGYATLLRMLALLAIVLVLALLAGGQEEERPWSRYLLALAAVGFVRLSEVGASTHPSLGVAGFTALQVLVFGGLGLCCLRGLRRSSGVDRGEEGLTSLDLWLANLGLLLFAGAWLVTVLRQGLGAQAALAGLRKGLAALSLVALFLLSVKQARGPRSERAAAALLAAAMAAAAVLGAVRFARVQSALDKGARALGQGQASTAMAAAGEADSGNARLGWPPFSLRAMEIRRDAFAAENRQAEALAEMRAYLLARRKAGLVRASYAKSAYSAGPELYDFYTQYLEPKPLAPLLQASEDLRRTNFFRDIHGGDERDLADDALAVLLFLRNGFLDRLVERYATAGFPECDAYGGYEPALRDFGRRHPERAAEARFFLGVAQFRAGRYPAALETLRQVLAAQPQYHNAVAYGQRLAAIQGFSNLPDAMTTRSTRIPSDLTCGNHRWGLNVAGTLWTAFEHNPGTYRISLEVRGQAALGQWPRLAVYLGEEKEPVLSAIVPSPQWTRVSFERAFSSEGCQRLLIVFENDFFGKNARGVLENRNLEFRQALVEFTPQSAARR